MEFNLPTKITEQSLVSSTGQFSEQPMAGRRGFHTPVKLAVCSGSTSPTPTMAQSWVTTASFSGPPTPGKLDPQTSGTTNQLRAVWFTDANTGVVVGDQGTILRTTDGGESWVPETSSSSEMLLGLSFADASNGTALGQLGTILRTTDGGQTWAREESGTNQDLYSVSFSQTNTGTAVGAYGAILRTESQGPTPSPTPNRRPLQHQRPRLQSHQAQRRELLHSRGCVQHRLRVQGLNLV